ncbi:hypothetical protein PoB_006178100 [Plakobranchus ocellatus]|uniref:Uncharacterized protein n=1 Tax=Plakobranchus ocellatus TaxID=259542 RepID=A0AAV4CTP2_9GAST|nr:hypothetical protein PoB_006178100 [Plakobranchus ocellatus]
MFSFNMVYMDNELKETGPSEASPALEDAHLKARERSKIISYLNAKYEGQDDHERQDIKWAVSSMCCDP